MFNCTVEGGLITVWSGTAFDCPGNNHNYILLRHIDFASGSATGSCNSGHVVGHGTGVSDDESYYMSRLEVNVSESFNNQTIECGKYNGTIITVATSTITVISG